MLPCNANHELARDAPNTIPVECPDPCAAPVDPYRVAIADPMEGGGENSILISLTQMLGAFNFKKMA